VIERSVIICDSENVSIDESWLVGHSAGSDAAIQPLSEKLATQEKEMIEAALAECNGRPPGSCSQAWNSTIDSRFENQGSEDQ
jgi:formate hydrogenlyase transcriptional activator